MLYLYGKKWKSKLYIGQRFTAHHQLQINKQPNMKFFIISSFVLVAAVGQEDYYIDPSCVDISMHGDVEFNRTVHELCNFKMTTNCKTTTERVCEDIIVTDCKIVGYTECYESTEEEEVPNDIVNQHQFPYKTCTPYKTYITEYKHLPQCTNVTKERCDSKWVINGYGKKVWDSKVNCRDVTWEECKLVSTPVKQEVEAYKCVDAKDPIYYETVTNKIDSVSLNKRTCRAVAKPVCEVSTKTVCEDVEIYNCEDVIEPNCFNVEFSVPYQEKEHLLRCPFNH